MANYTSGQDRSHHEEPQVLNLTDTLNESQDQRSSPSCPSEASTIDISYTQREQNTKGVNSLSVITPLQVGDQPSRTVADLNSESTDAGSLSLSERDRRLFYREERMVEGSSVKSQPRSSQSRDSTTHHTTMRSAHSKCTYPTSGVELLRGQKVQSPSRSTISSAQTSITGTSCRTTASEAEFRSDLASLDADIARLQMQFRVAMLTPLPR